MNDDRRDNFILAYASTEPPTIEEGAQCHLRCEPLTNALIVTSAPPGPASAATPYYSPLANTGTIKASPGVLLSVAGRYMGALPLYFMLFDLAGPPVVTDSPNWPSMPMPFIPGGFPFGFAYPGGLKFSAAGGIQWAISSTPETYTPVVGSFLALGATFS